MIRNTKEAGGEKCLLWGEFPRRGKWGERKTDLRDPRTAITNHQTEN